MFEPVKLDSIFLPNGTKLNIRESQAARAVSEYDASLMLGQRRDTGEWVVFLKSGPEGQPFPVLGLGHELPTPEEIKRRMYAADTKRHGGKIALRVDRHNEERKRAARKQADEGVGATVEAFDWGLRKMGVHPHPRIFVPGGDS